MVSAEIDELLQSLAWAGRGSNQHNHLNDCLNLVCHGIMHRRIYDLRAIGVEHQSD